MLRPAFTAVDIATDMVAFLDDLPKVLVTRLNFSGKVEDAANWIALLRRTLKPRVTVWMRAVMDGGWDPRSLITSTTIADPDLIAEVQKSSELVSAYGAFLLPLIDRTNEAGSTLFSIVNNRDDLCDNGVLMIMFISQRGLAISNRQVQAIEKDIAKLSLAAGGDLQAHEAVKVQLEALVERIHPQSRRKLFTS